MNLHALGGDLDIASRAEYCPRLAQNPRDFAATLPLRPRTSLLIGRR